MKTISRVLASLILVATASLACAQVKAPANNGYYAEAGLLGLKFKDSTDSSTPKLARFVVGKDINASLAVEAMGALTIDKADGLSANELAVFAKPKFLINKDTNAFIRVGAARTGAGGTGDGHITRAAYGFGVETQLTKDVYGQVDYMHYAKSGDLNVRGFTLSVGTRF
jgi:hypothetical protein